MKWMTTNTKPSSRTRLTAKQEAFCAFYFTSRNATQSAIKAGYPVTSSRVIAVENLTKPAIKTRLAELQAHKMPTEEEVYASYDKRLSILSKIANHNIETPVGAGHITQAVSEMNKMEHVYETGGNIRDVSVVFVIGKGYRDLPKLIEGEKG